MQLQYNYRMGSFKSLQILFIQNYSHENKASDLKGIAYGRVLFHFI